MTRLRISSIAVAACVLFAAVSAHAESAACAANVTKSGSFFTGSTTKTHVDFSNLSSSVAFKRIYAHLVQDGWTVDVLNKDLGLIAVSKKEFIGSDKSTALNFLIEDAGTGSKVTITHPIAAGVVPTDTVNILCKPIADIVDSN